MVLTSLVWGLHPNHGPRRSIYVQSGAVSPCWSHAGGALVYSSAMVTCLPGYGALLLRTPAMG